VRWTSQYTYTDGNGCSNSDSLETKVLASPTANITSPTSFDYCSNTDSILMTGAPTGGLFAGSGVSGDYFYPDQAQLGVNTIYYTFTDTNGCVSEAANIYMNVLATPVVQFTSSLNSVYCSNSPMENVYAYPSGGSFSGAGVSGNTIDFNSGGSGQRMVKYSYTAANGCSNADSLLYQVNDAPLVSITQLT
jgi:hypothetical protein